MNNRKRNQKSFIIWGVASLFYLYEVVLRVSPGVMIDNLMLHYGVTTSMLGVIVSCFYFSYTALQVPCGLILDKLGAKILIGASVMLSVFGLVMFAMTSQIYAAELGRCLIGAGAACAFTSSLQIASVVFHSKYFPIFAGITNMMGTFGALCAGFPVAKAVNTFGWRETILFLAIVGLAIAMLVFLFIPRVVKIHGDVNIQKSFMSIFFRVMKNRQIVLSGLVGGFMYLPVSVFSELWAIPFFMVKYNVNNEYASFATSILFIGFAIGSIPLAIIAKKVNGYVKTMRFSMIFAALLFIPLICVHDICLSFAIIFLIGVSTSGQVLVFTCARNNESHQNIGTTIAMTNGLIMMLGLIFQPIFGILLDSFWTGKLSEQGVRIYEVSCYDKAILILPICLVVAYVLSFFIKETLETEQNL